MYLGSPRDAARQSTLANLPRTAAPGLPTNRSSPERMMQMVVNNTLQFRFTLGRARMLTVLCIGQPPDAVGRSGRLSHTASCCNGMVVDRTPPCEASVWDVYVPHRAGVYTDPSQIPCRSYGLMSGARMARSCSFPPRLVCAATCHILKRLNLHREPSRK